MAGATSLIEPHLNRIREFFDTSPRESSWFGQLYRGLVAGYYRFLIPPDASILEIGCGAGELLAQFPNRDVTGVDLSYRQIARAKQIVPHGKFHVGAAEFLAESGLPRRQFDYIVLSEMVNYAADVQRIFEELRPFAGPHTRLVQNFYNTLWYPILRAATLLRLKSPQPVANWLSCADVKNLLALGDWELIREVHHILLPMRAFGLGTALNRFIAPFLKHLCLTTFLVARPRISRAEHAMTVSVIVPARNEGGNIEAAVRRIPEMGRSTEIIFIEGHSKDDTLEQIQRVVATNRSRDIKYLQQSGTGKGNAVREGFTAASGDLLMILDADLTMPPEELPKFYDALISGRTEFANGVRLVYPMEHKAMRFLNMCANKFFSVAFGWTLGQPVKDTLCGTKALSRQDYMRIAANRSFFGDFDPFGDFDLLFGANKLNLKITDIPVRYRERTYGQTNIQRWSHGWLLLKMLGFALLRIKFV
jgi:SAM-dependent methyltransferase